ncbi:hypothetical protein HDV01_000969 [Terramyces sp. JEL0728]|nr:hypothetical protein HDV01_000969 [Terramyces sp. JEL0728]
MSKTYIPLKDTSKHHSGKKESTMGMKSSREFGSREILPDGSLSKSRSESSLLMLMEETKFYSKTKNALIAELRTHNRFRDLENDGYSMAKLPILHLDEGRPSIAKSAAVSRESSMRRGKTRIGTAQPDPYGNLMSRVENIFETESMPVNPELLVERKHTGKIYPEERLPVPSFGDDMPPRLGKSASVQKSIAEQSYRPSVRSRLTDRKKYDYQQELDMLKFKEEMQDQDSDEELEEFSDNGSVESLHESKSEEIWSPPEAFKSLDDIKQSKIFANTPPELRPGLISGLSAIHKEGSKFDPKGGASIFEWATSSSQWRRMGTKKLPQTNVAVPLGPKGYVDAAIVFAEKQMEAWEKMKAEMLIRTGQKANKFKSFHDNRVDKSTLNTIISVKLWKKRALDNRKMRNEPIRKVLFKEERDFACKIPPTIQEYILEESVKIIENYEKLYENFLGADNEKTVGSRRHKNVILSQQPGTDATLETEQVGHTQKKFSIRALRFGSFRSNHARVVPVNDIEEYEEEEHGSDDIQVVVVPNRLPPVKGPAGKLTGDEVLIKIQEEMEEGME